MQARIVQTPQGALWLVDGWRLFRAAPFGWLLVAFIYVFFTHILAILPIIGLAASLFAPTLTVGLMAVARAVSRGGSLEVGLLFDGFRHDLRPQLLLGVIFLVCAILLIAGTRLADTEGVLSAIVAGSRKIEETSFGDLFAPLAVFALIYAPITMMFWFAPPLAAWHSIGPTKALFFSFVACLMNWRAFLAYAVATVLITTVVPVLLLAAIMLFSGGAPPPQTMVLLGIVLITIVLPTLLASFYATYRDVFGGEKAGVE